MKTKIIVLTIVLRTKNDAKTNGEVSIMLRNKKYFSIIFGFLLFFSLIVQGNPVYGDNTGYEPENPGIKDEQTAEGDLGMVVTAHTLASKVGSDVLRNGGCAKYGAV